jgi:hypothetical protein
MIDPLRAQNVPDGPDGDYGPSIIIHRRYLHMIIRLQNRRSYVALPNAVFRDPRLSLEAKGLLAYLASLPPNWEIRPPAVLAALQHETAEGSRPLGREKLYRLFKELIAAGYMARTIEQGRGDHGQFGSYVYIVGAEPDIVAEEAQALADSEGVSFLPQSAKPHAAAPCAAKPTADKERVYREPEITNYPKAPSTEQAETPHCLQDDEAGETTAIYEPTEHDARSYIEYARSTGQVFVFENSAPFRSWLKYRRANGIIGAVPIVTDIIDGRPRRGMFQPSLWPPRGGAGAPAPIGNVEDPGRRAALNRLASAAEQRPA